MFPAGRKNAIVCEVGIKIHCRAEGVTGPVNSESCCGPSKSEWAAGIREDLNLCRKRHTRSTGRKRKSRVRTEERH